MSDIRLGLDGDLDLSSGSPVLIDGVDAIAQLLAQRLRMFYGEWFLNLDQGVPYFEKILVKGADPTVIDSVLKSAILGTPGILRLTQFETTLNRTSRTLSVTGQAVSTAGVVDFNIGDLGA